MIAQEETIKKAVKWISSKEGMYTIAKASKQAARVSEAYMRAQAVNVESLNKPMNI